MELNALEGDLLMIKRLMGSKMQALDQIQREKYFPYYMFYSRKNMSIYY